MHDTPAARHLVFGASGYIGSYLVPALVERGIPVRAVARNRDVLEGRAWQGVDIRAADALDPSSLEGVFDGVEVVYYLVHSMGGGPGFEERDRLAAEAVGAAAARAGVKRIMYLGGLQPPGELSAHLTSRRETGEVLRASGVHVTELRAGIIVGPGSAAFEMIRDLTYHLPVMITPRWVRSKTQPIALDDLLAYLIELASMPAAAGRTYDVGGPETLTYGQLIHQFAQAAGLRKRLLVPVPVLTPRLSSYWLDLVTAVPSSVARPLIDGLKHDLVASERSIRTLVPRDLQTYRQSVTAALARERAEPLLARWAEGSFALRGSDPSISYYSKGAITRTPARASAEEVWDSVRRIGGNTGYYYLDSLWKVRGVMDRLVGGVGMRRGRRHPTDIRVGDAIDFWRVANIEPGRRLTLVAEMRLPGRAVLEFEVRPLGESASELITTARFHPAGAPGLLYWYSVWPFHGFIFNGMPRNMVRRAESRAAKR